MSERLKLEELDLHNMIVGYRNENAKSVETVLEEAGFKRLGDIPSESTSSPIRIPANSIPGVDSELIIIRKSELINYAQYMGLEYVVFQRR
jgi:hypothetical protein